MAQSVHVLNDMPIISMDASFPRSGAWIADVVISNPINKLQGVPLGVPPVEGSPCLITVDTQTFLGSALAVSSLEVGTIKLRVIGGLTGGLAKLAPPSNLALGPTLQVAAAALLASAKEAFNPALSSPVAATTLPGYQVLADRTVAQNLTRLAQAVNASWRVDLKTGTVFFVRDLFKVPALLPTNASVHSTLAGVMTDYDCPLLNSMPLPGQSAPDGSQINEVRLVTNSESIHVQLFQAQAGALFAAAMGADTSRSYPVTVVGPNPDGTLQVKPDDASVAPAMARVRVRGIPSATYNVLPGTRASVMFDNGDPTQLPFIVAFMGPDVAEGLIPVPPTGGPLFGLVLGQGAVEPLAKATSLNSQLTTLTTLLETAATTLSTVVLALLPIAGPTALQTAAASTALLALATQVTAFQAAILVEVPSKEIQSA